VAEAAAAGTKANAEASKAVAEAAAAVDEAAAAAAANWRRTWLFRVVTGTAIALVLDYVWHEDETVIKWNMARRLRACKLPTTVPEKQVPEQRLETHQPRLQQTFLVTMLLGPTGCGKSTVLKDLVRAFILAGTPTFLIGFRKPMDHETPMGPSNSAEALELMNATAAQVFHQVGFPTRRSIISRLLDVTAKELKLEAEVKSTGVVSAKAEGTATLAPSVSRLMTCITCLFNVAEQVAFERQAAGKRDLAGAVVLAFDELEDLIKDDRLRLAGGKLVLDHLSSLMVNASVDHRFVQVYLAGSSAKLAFALASPAKGNRMAYVYQADPTHEAMLKALMLRKYSAEDAARMVDLCGTRLRLFEGPLTWEEPPSASAFMAAAVLAAEGDFARVQSSLADTDKALFAAVLDAVEKSYSGGLTVQENKATMPPSAAHIDLAPILFVNHGYTLKFQSDLHRNVWKTERKRPEWRGK
jgi:hypothetical protein